MRHWRAIPVALLASLAVLGGNARAASISYVLDQSNADPLLPDGDPYLAVALAESINGAITFAVNILPRLANIADAGFGLRSFAFSSQGPANVLLASNIVGLPSGWSVTFGKSAGNFGGFDVLLQGGSGAAVAPTFSFSITGVAADTVADYAVLSRGRAVEGRAYFAALVGGFEDQDPGRKTLTKAWFGGSRPTMSVVPLPGAAWLLTSALGVLSLSRRRASLAATGRAQRRP